MTRTAISPRLAMRIFPNMGGAGAYPRASVLPLGVPQPCAGAVERALELAQPRLVADAPSVDLRPVELDPLAAVADLGPQLVEGRLAQIWSRLWRAARSRASRSARSCSARRCTASLRLAISSQRALKFASAERRPCPACFGASAMWSSMCSGIRATEEWRSGTLGRGAAPWSLGPRPPRASRYLTRTLTASRGVAN